LLLVGEGVLLLDGEGWHAYELRDRAWSRQPFSSHCPIRSPLSVEYPPPLTSTCTSIST
jgi:hypothetical protein